MKIFPDCFPCFFRQSNIALDHAGIATKARIFLLREISSTISESDLSGSPAHVTTYIHRVIRNRIGDDPFRKVKSLYNQKALDMYPDLKKIIESSKDPLRTATRLSIAGNIIDFGIFTSFDMEGIIERALADQISVDEYELFRNDIENARAVLYLLDNAGEIVFDKLLIETLKTCGIDVTAVVKGAPVLNDTTQFDAVQVGLDSICRVIDNGSDAVGTILEWSSKDFKDEFLNADMIISKGQGNFETLMGENNRNIHFLFQSKCEVVSRYLGLEKGSMILSRGIGNWKSKA